MKNLICSLTLAALALTVLALPASAQDTAAAAANPCAEDARGEMYTNYYNKKKGDAASQKEAYGIAKEYTQKYGSCNDQYSKAVQKFISDYDAAVTKLDCPKYLYGTDAQNTGRDFNKAFDVCGAILASDPENLSLLIQLGYAGYNAQNLPTPITTFSPVSLGHAKKAVEMLEAGKTPDKWVLFKSKDEALGYLNFAVGEYMIKSDPAGALPYYLKALSYNTEVKNTALTYARLAAAYQAGQYDPMQKAFTTEYGGKPETDESKHALNNLNQVIDRVMDAYARAISLAGNDPKLQQAKASWKEVLTGFYKFRNNDSATGLDTFIAGVTSKPLPQPFTPEPYVPSTTPPATGTSSGNDAGNGTMSSPSTANVNVAAPATAAKPATATNATGTTTATQPMAKPKTATKKP